MLVTQEFTVKAEGKTILNDLHLDFGPGIHIIMGPNGIGKSTLAHALMGNPKYTVSGAAQLDGKDILALEPHERARAGLFVSFQNPTPIAGISNFQFVKESLIQQEKMTNSMSDITQVLNDYKDYSDVFGLPSDFHKKQLNVEASGGEKKKNEIIQMLLSKPKVSILDEPDSGLDIDSINQLSKQLKTFALENDSRTVIIITHYEKLIDSLSPDTVTILRKDKVEKGDVELAYKVFKDGFGE